ncbi:MAG: GGDEF domain-containing protein [Clostridiales bacterium]|nr:GGDEF domain-containing protein [Clostridiales bacterium]
MYNNTNIEKLLEQSKLLATQNPQESYDLAKKAMDLSKSTHNPLSYGYSLFHMAYACRVMSDYSKGLELAFQALEIFKKHENTIGILKASNIIGIIYFYFGAYTDALDYFMTSVSKIHKDTDPGLESSLYNNIGEIYRMAEDYSSAIFYYEKGIEICEAHGLESNKAVIHLNIGEIFYRQEKYEASYDELMKSYSIVMKHNDMINQGEAETKLGRAMQMKGDYKAAEIYYNSALEKITHVNNKFYLVELLIEMAKLDELTGINPLKRWNEALEHAIGNKLDNKVCMIYKSLSYYYERNQMFEKALTYHKAYHVKEKEIDAVNLSKRLEILSVEFQYFKEKERTKKIELLTNKLEDDIKAANEELNQLMAINTTLQKETLIDDLTQLYNRRGIDRMFSTQINETGLVSGVILFIDIDHFKTYNDNFGHIQGDVCLKTLSDNIKAIVGNIGFVGRYGGEEFLCFIRVDSYNKALSYAEKLRTTVESLSIPSLEGLSPTKVTISVGGSYGQINAANLKHFTKLADEQLYNAKDSGRNMVIVVEVK